MTVKTKIFGKLKSEYSRAGIISLSREIEKSYSNALLRMSGLSQYSGFKNGRNPNPEYIKSHLEAAKNMYWYYPAHAIKFLRILLDHESEWTTEPERTCHSVLAQKDIQIIDIGSGYGTIPSVFIDFSIQHQNVRKTLKCPVFPMNIKYIPIDPNLAPLQVAEILLKPLIQTAHNNLIKVEKSKEINLPFPEDSCIAYIEESMSPNLVNYITMSNVLTWITRQSYTEDHALEIVQALHKICKRDAKSEVNLILVEPQKDVRRFGFIKRIIESIKKRFSPSYSPPITKDLLSRIKNLAGFTISTKFDSKDLPFCNPPDSPFREKYNRKQGPTKFAYGWGKITHKRGIISQILDPENIRLAWAKARWDSYREDIPMIFESKLFEGNLDGGQFFEANLDNIATILAHPNMRTLELRRYPYEVPKRKGKRTRTLTSLEEKIISQAVLNIIGPLIEAEFDKLGEKGGTSGVSWGHRLNCQNKKIHRSEWIFRPPIWQYKKHIQNLTDRINNAPDDSVVLLTDIKGFYDNIPTDELLSLLNEALKKVIPEEESEVYAILELLTRKDNGVGVPQSSPLPHFLANLYLHYKLDTNIVNDNHIFYYSRYVDDIAVITSKKYLDEIKGKIKSWISPLELNLDKTNKFDKEEFINNLELEKQEDLNKISEEVREILKSLYELPYRLYKDYRRNPNAFSIRYSQVLSAIGVNLSPIWLKRKLNIGILKSVQISLRKKNSILPLPEEGKEEQWASKYIKRNSVWLGRKKGVTSDLVCIVEEAGGKLLSSNSNGADKIMERRARFAIYRLGLLTNSKTPKLVYTLLDRSSVAPTALKALAAYPEAKNTLRDYIKSKPMPYLSSIALLSLAMIDKNAAAKEAFSILNSPDPPQFEKYSVAEALLNTVKHSNGSNIPTIYQKWHSSKDPSLAPLTSLLSDEGEYKKEIGDRGFDLDEDSFFRLACQFSSYYPGQNPLDLPEIDPPDYKSEYYPVVPPEVGFYYYGITFYS